MRNMHLIVCFFTIFSFLGCGQGSEKEIYLIPSTFKGKVNVIYNRTKGTPVKYKDGARVYEIPKDGILLTQYKEQQGTIKREYFYVDENNNRKPLKIVVDMDSINSSVIAVFRDGTIGVYGNSNDKNSLTYQEFYVTDKDNLENYFSDDSINNFTKRLQVKTNYKF